MFNLSNIIKKPTQKCKTSFTETAKPSHEQVWFQFHPEPSQTNYFIKKANMASGARLLFTFVNSLIN